MSSSSLSWHSSVKISDRSEIIKLLKLVIQARSNNKTDLLLIDIIEQKLYNDARSLEDYVNIRNLPSKVINIINELKSDYTNKMNNINNTTIALTQQEIASAMSGESTTPDSYDIADLDRMLSILSDNSETSNPTSTTSNVTPAVTSTLTNSSNNDKHVTIIIDDDGDEVMASSSHSNSNKPTSSLANKVHNIGHNSDHLSLPMDVIDEEVKPVENNLAKEANDKLRQGKLCTFVYSRIPMILYIHLVYI